VSSLSNSISQYLFSHLHQYFPVYLSSISNSILHYIFSHLDQYFPLYYLLFRTIFPCTFSSFSINIPPAYFPPPPPTFSCIFSPVSNNISPYIFPHPKLYFPVSFPPISITVFEYNNTLYGSEYFYTKIRKKSSLSCRKMWYKTIVAMNSEAREIERERRCTIRSGAGSARFDACRPLCHFPFSTALETKGCVRVIKLPVRTHTTQFTGVRDKQPPGNQRNYLH